MEAKWLSANIDFKKQCPLQDKILKSKIIEKNGEKIGLIGVSPFDFKKLAFIDKKTNSLDILPLKETIDALQAEVSKLKDEDVDIILLLAHTGEKDQNGRNYYDEFAKIEGIDVIIGGHDHRQVGRWNTSVSGEPVRIISTGRSLGRAFGENLDVVAELNLDFDENGVLIKDNSKIEFKHFDDNCPVSPSEVLYELDEPLKRSNDVLLGHSEIGNLTASSNLWYVNSRTKGKKADIAFVNPGTIRANFDNKNITQDDIQAVLPFTSSTLIKTTLTKKQIIDTLARGAFSTTFTKVSPGIMQVAGMEYTINPDLSISDVHILNEDDSVKYDLDDFDDDKRFGVVYDVFLATGAAGLKDLVKDCDNDSDVESFGISRQEAMEEYLKNCDNIADYHKVRIIQK